MVLSKDNDGVLYVLDHPFEGDMGSLALTSLNKIQKTCNTPDGDFPFKTLRSSHIHLNFAIGLS